MITIVGAGSIGLSLGGRLARAGADVAFLTRRAAAAHALRSRGVTVTDPASGDTFMTSVVAHHRLDELSPARRGGVFLLCTRTTELEALARELGPALPGALFVCSQNDVDSEARMAMHARRVAGLVHRQTCTRQDDASVFALGPGRLVVGRHPEGFDGALESLATAAERAGFSVGRSRSIGRDKWLKLCVNLMSTPNALVRRDDHASAAFVEGKVRLLEEARKVLAAAAIRAEPCDSGDRSLEAEIAHQRASLVAGTSARPLPLYNAVWRALRDRTLGLEADRFHARIIELGRAHRIATPVNARALLLLLRARETGEGPESIAAAALLDGSA